MPRSAWIVGTLAFVLPLVLLGATSCSSKGRVPEEQSRRPAAAAPPSASAPPTSTEETAAKAVETALSLTIPSAPLPEGPELPATAPKSVSFGVVLLTYRGAEQAPSDARSKEAALARAKELVEPARKDFDDAVKKGDRGSTVQAGTMPRGVLEPSLEYVLFTLKKGEVYGEPVDTPRGYWILRRNE
jgi:hypothetical protein